LNLYASGFSLERTAEDCFATFLAGEATGWRACGGRVLFTRRKGFVLARAGFSLAGGRFLLTGDLRSLAARQSSNSREERLRKGGRTGFRLRSGRIQIAAKVDLQGPSSAQTRSAKADLNGEATEIDT